MTNFDTSEDIESFDYSLAESSLKCRPFCHLLKARGLFMFLVLLKAYPVNSLLGTLRAVIYRPKM